jgi:uncharacterized membrane protein
MNWQGKYKLHLKIAFLFVLVVFFSACGGEKKKQRREKKKRNYPFFSEYRIPVF